MDKELLDELEQFKEIISENIADALGNLTLVNDEIENEGLGITFLIKAGYTEITITEKGVTKGE